MAGSLSGAWAKFDRAEEHLEALIRVTRSGHVRWGHQYPVTPEAHRNGLEYRFYVDRAPALDAEAGRKHYVNGADLLDDFTDKQRRLSDTALPDLIRLEQPCLVRERCRLRRATERYAQTMFCSASPTVALDPSACPTRCFARASNGIVGAVKAARPIPTQLVSGWCAPKNVRTDSTPT